MSAENVVIIGAGLAGATTAETLREDGFDGKITLLGAEDHLPYLRPPLSKEYLAGVSTRESTDIHPAAWYEENLIDVQTNRSASSLDLADHSITLADESTVRYDRLVLATGASPRRFDAPGSDARGVYYLRTVDDSESLREVLKAGNKKVVLVGAGWIGLEVASAARTYGNDVTVIGHGTIPLGRLLGDELGAVFQDVHEANGVTFNLPRSVKSFQVSEGNVTGVVTDQDELLPADVVVMGTGTVPNDALAARAGLEVENGVLVDQHLTSSHADVFAVGDVASALHPRILRHMRNEHWGNAVASGKIAAKSVQGKTAVLDEIPYFYTDQFDLGMEYSGFPPLARGASVIIRGDKGKHEFVAFWVADGKVVAGMNVNVWDVNDQVQALIRSERVVDLGRLADPNVPLAQA